MIFIFVLILNCFCIVFMVFNFLIYFTLFCDHLSQKNDGHLLMLLSIVFGKEAWLRHVVVWLFANYSWSYSAARGPNVWKVSFCSLFFAWTLLFTVCQQSEHSVEKCDCRVWFFLAGLQIYLGHGQLCPWHVLQLLSSFCCWPQQTLQPCCSSIKSPQSLCMSSLVSIKPTLFLSFANNVAEQFLHLFRFILNVNFIYPE